MDNLLQCRNNSRTTQEKPEMLSRCRIDSKPNGLFEEMGPTVSPPPASASGHRYSTIFLLMDFTLNVVMDVSVS